MTLFKLSWSSITARPLQSFLSVLATTTGVALLTLVFLLSQSIQNGFFRNAQGVDLVVGAKASPLQLVLSGVYQIDVPTANLDEHDFERIVHNPRVKKAIPLVYGDNHNGFKIIGTTPDYIELYKGQIHKGRIWTKSSEVVAGSNTGLKVGDHFTPTHGFSDDGDGHEHENEHYNVTAVLKPSGTVLDRLILTSFESVNETHHHDHHEEDHHEAHSKTKITAFLIQVVSPIDKMNLPRVINESDKIMAVSPSYEIARLAKNIGIGKSILIAMGLGFVALSSLILLSSLSSSLLNRRYDLAILRVLGASRKQLFAVVIFEGVLLSLIGALLGILLGHAVGWSMANLSKYTSSLLNSQDFLSLGHMDAYLLILSIGIGILSAIWPAIKASQTDIATLLAKGIS